MFHRALSEVLGFPQGLGKVLVRHRDTDTKRQRHRDTETQAQRYPDTLQADFQTNSQTDPHTNSQTDSQTNTRMYREMMICSLLTPTLTSTLRPTYADTKNIAPGSSFIHYPLRSFSILCEGLFLTAHIYIYILDYSKTRD